MVAMVIAVSLTMTCTQLREATQGYSQQQLEQMAKERGLSRWQVAKARACLRNRNGGSQFSRELTALTHS